MRGGLTPQQVLLLALMALGLLLNLLLRWIRERAEGPAERGGPRPADVPTPRPTPARPPVPATRPAPAAVAPSPKPPSAGPRVPGPHRQARALRLGRRRARDAIVLMAVLGPCRAAAPQGPDAVPTAPPSPAGGA